VREYGLRPSVAAPADVRRHRNRDDLGGEFTHIGCVQRPGIAGIDAESGAVSGGGSIAGRVHGPTALVGGYALPAVVRAGLARA